MARQCVDCREYPSESNCDLTICSGNEEHLIDAAVIHAVTVARRDGHARAARVRPASR